jgi:hypothetical protein
MKMCELVRRPQAPWRRRIPAMSDRRETDFLAYILAVFVFAIGGIAVGVASTQGASNRAVSSQAAPSGEARTGSGAVKPAGADRHRHIASQQHLL